MALSWYRHGNSISEQEYICRVNERHNGTIEVIGDYINNKKRIRVRCKICGHEWEPIAANVVKTGAAGCPKCSQRKRGPKKGSHKMYNQKKFIHDLNRLWAIGCPVNSGWMQKNMPLYYGRAVNNFGSWRSALESAGFDYNDVMVNPRRGKQYYINYLKSVYESNGRIAWNDIRNMNGSQRYFKSYKDWFVAAGVPVSNMPSQITQWSKFGRRFERIVKLIFDELYPLYIYQFTGIQGIRPDWYDPNTRIAYDAKLSLSTIEVWSELDTYLDSFSHVVVIYLRDNIDDYDSDRVSVIHVNTFLPYLSESTAAKVKSKLDQLLYNIDNLYSTEDAVSVWEQHYGRIPDDMYVHHIDGNIYNNDISNLELVDEYSHKLYVKGCYKNENGEWMKKCVGCNEERSVEHDFNKFKRGDLVWCKFCYRKSCAKYKETIGNDPSKFIFQSGDLVAWRGWNGTTINGEFVRYIKPGDVVPWECGSKLGAKPSDAYRALIKCGDKHYAPHLRYVKKSS